MKTHLCVGRCRSHRGGGGGGHLSTCLSATLAFQRQSCVAFRDVCACVRVRATVVLSTCPSRVLRNMAKVCLSGHTKAGRTYIFNPNHHWPMTMPRWSKDVLVSRELFVRRAFETAQFRLRRETGVGGTRPKCNFHCMLLHAWHEPHAACWDILLRSERRI